MQKIVLDKWHIYNYNQKLLKAKVLDRLIRCLLSYMILLHEIKVFHSIQGVKHL